MRKLIFKALLILLLLTTLFGGICWFYSAPLLDSLVRPQIEKLAAQVLDAQVQIGQLVSTDDGLMIRDLQINAPEQGSAFTPQMTLDFSIEALWTRQFEALRIVEPQISLFPKEATDKTAEQAFEFPRQLPLSIEKLTVTKGRMSLQGADQNWQLHDVNLSGSLQQHSNYHFTAFFGPDKNHPLAADGSFALEEQSLTLNSLAWQDQQLLTTPVTLRAVNTAATFGGGALQLERFDRSKLQEILAALRRPRLLPENLDFSLTDISLDIAVQNQSLALEFKGAESQLDWDGLRATFHQLNLQLNRVESGWQAVGKLRGPAQETLAFTALLDAENGLSGQAQLLIPDPARLKSELFGGPDIKVSGGLQLTAEYTLKNKQLELTIDLYGQPATEPNRAYLLDISKLHGRGKLLQTVDDEKLSVALQQGSQPFFSANGDFQQLIFSLLAADLEIIKELLPPELIPAQIQTVTGLKVAGQVRKESANWSADIKLTADKINAFATTLQQSVVRSKTLISTDRLKFTETSLSLKVAQGDALEAQIEAFGFGQLSSQQFSLTLEKLALTHLNYISADEQTGVGEAQLELQGKLAGSWPEGPIAIDLNGQAAMQELLTGAFYAELGDYPVNYSLTGELMPKTSELMVKALSFELSQLGTLTSAGLISSKQINLQSHFKLTDLATSYGEHIGPLLSEIKPAAAELTLEGKLALDTQFHWSPDSWQANGYLRLQGLDAYWQRQQLEMVEGLGAIPFAIGAGDSPQEKEATEYFGEIAFDSLSVGLATLEEGQLQLAAATNRFSFRSPLFLKLAGGRVAIENLKLSWPDKKPQGSVKLNISAVDLETLTAELGLPIMQGRLSANLGTLHYRDQELQTDGLASIEVFGGQFQLRNMHYSKPFSNYPTFYTDIDFSNLDLLQATRTFDFGEMNGVLNGHIHGLKLFGKTPAAFEAAVATSDKGKRNISVKALNNLSILSQGGLSSVLSRGVYQFIDFYRYKKIGFKCSLKNDTFTLLGAALPGSNRYLVHGGILPPRIDITTSTPTISFKEMLNRLGRIERAGS